jgi:hypothetical protein
MIGSFFLQVPSVVINDEHACTQLELIGHVCNICSKLHMFIARRLEKIQVDTYLEL